MNKTIIILILLFIICVGAGGFSLYNIHKEQADVLRAEELSGEYADFSPSAFFAENQDESTVFNEFLPKLEQLQAVNPDVVGWIYIPQTHIDYPLLQGSDNNYYLTHAVNGEYSSAGSVFVDERGVGDNTVIYAHNMGRASNVMFHDITNFADENWFNKVQKGYIITGDGITELNIFAYSLTLPQSQFYFDDVSLDYIKSNCVHYRNVEDGGKMITLSTCAYDYDNARAVLSCMANEIYKVNTD